MHIEQLMLAKRKEGYFISVLISFQGRNMSVKTNQLCLHHCPHPLPV